MYNVLVCDDDTAICNSVKIYLEQEGYNVLTASNGREALEIIENDDIHCLVLDIMMPEVDGISATLKIREKYNFPIIMLSAKSEDTDKIAGLSFGADDYVTKPFNPLELMARVKSQIRRYSTLGSMMITDSQLVTGGLVLDTKKKLVTLDGDEVRLTAHEFKILEYLMQNLNCVLSSSQIYEAVWNEPSFGAEKTVTVHIRNIREKIEINPKDPKYLKVVY
ncbi:MAG: response regulator transcription factor, partial [Eubacterium sp.]|nr:response regulator transcription factor [Eubacterium sp.]